MSKSSILTLYKFNYENLKNWLYINKAKVVNSIFKLKHI